MKNANSEVHLQKKQQCVALKEKQEIKPYTYE